MIFLLLSRYGAISSLGSGLTSSLTLQLGSELPDMAY